MSVWTKWAWHLGTPDMSEHDSYEDAISAACYAADYGEESFDCIEGPDGVVPADKVKEDMRAVDDARYAEEKRSREASPMTHAVKVRQPNGDREAWFGSYLNVEAAEAAADGLRERYGDRVRVVALDRNGAYLG